MSDFYGASSGDAYNALQSANLSLMLNKRGVRTVHPEYAAQYMKWVRCRDATAGSDAIKGKGRTYLPRLNKQSDEQYNGMKMRANFYNGTRRTVYGLLGMIFRKEPVKNVPDKVKEYLKDIDMKGTPFDVLAEEACEEVLEVGKVGILVDCPPWPTDANGQPLQLSVAEAEAQGLRPTIKTYCAEQIINWRETRVGNSYVLGMVVLKEKSPERVYNEQRQLQEFETNYEDRYRVLDLDTNGNYRVRVYKIFNETDLLIETTTPLMDNQPMKEIPFFVVNPYGIDLDTKDPPLIDLVDVNLSHYLTSADYEHGCHFVGVPTLYVAGYSPAVPEAGEGAAEPIYLGAETAIILPDPKGKVGFAEFSGQGLTALEHNLDRKEAQMAILGARMLATEGKVSQTATTTAIHRTGENSILSSIAISVSLGLSLAVTLFAKWSGVSQISTIKLNKDFLPVVIDGNMLVAMMQAWQAGAISDEEFFDWVQRGDIVEADLSFADHKAMTFQPKLLVGPAAGQAGSQGLKTNPEPH